MRSEETPIRKGSVRHIDLEQWRRLYDTAIEGVGANLVRKYRLEAERLEMDITLPDRVLDLDFLGDIEFIAHTGSGRSDLDGNDGLHELAINAAVRAHEVLTRQHISSLDLTAALKGIEAQYRGKWSDWI
jgi:hypothetical protein